MDQYIDQILFIDVDRNQAGQQPTPSNRSFMSPFGDSVADSGFDGTINSGELTLVEQSELDSYWSMQQSWDDIAIQFSDNFGIDFGAQFLKA